jgi:hypothetical protein
VTNYLIHGSAISSGDFMLEHLMKDIQHMQVTPNITAILNLETTGVADSYVCTTT